MRLVRIGDLRRDMTQTTDLSEIIRLQLRKPKNWNWQLTTSKSSPHIALPAIHLYNAKGKLLLQTSDTEALKNSWCSCSLNTNNDRPNGRNKSSNSLPRNLQRCRSVNLESHRNVTSVRQESIDRRFGSQQRPSKGRLSKSSANLLENKPAGVRIVTDAANENGSCENTINAAKNTTRRLRKSRSNVLDEKPNTVRSMFQESFQRNFMQPKQEQPERARCHARRSNSDALYRKSSRYSDESMKRAITDGYSNFLASPFAEDKPTAKGRRNRQYTKHNTENIAVSNNVQNADVTQLHHKTYKTRTSSAGTLIISDESFSFGRRRRERNDNANNHKRHANVQELLEKIRSRKNKQLRQISDPTAYNEQIVSEMHKRLVPVPSRRATENLFYSLSDVFPFAEMLEGEKMPECDDNSNYIVQEPITPSSDAKSRKNSGPILESAEWKKKAKLQRTLSVESTSSDALERRARHRGGGDGNKGKVSIFLAVYFKILTSM